MRPNILLLVSDQHRGDWLPYNRETKEKFGVTDLRIHMPVIEALMKRGVTFTNAVTPSPLCAPARACLASGRDYEHCRVADNTENYDLSLQTFYAVLKEGGYNVGGVGKFDLNKADLDWGPQWHKQLEKLGFSQILDVEGKIDAVIAFQRQVGDGPYMRYLEQKNFAQLHVEDMTNRGNASYATPLPNEHYCDNWIGRNGMQILQNFPQDKPWFLQVNFSGPHNPWDVTQDMKERWKNKEMPKPVLWSRTEDINSIRQNYAAMLENIDYNCGQLIDVVRQRGELDNTIIIYTADHGEMLGDHNRFNKSRPEQGSIHIPLVVDASALQGMQGVLDHSPVELQDLAATILDYAGLCFDMPCESLSMKPLIEGKVNSIRPFNVSRLHVKKLLSYAAKSGATPNLPRAFTTVSDGQYKLIMWEDGERNLFDLSIDPFECNDLIHSQTHLAHLLEESFYNQ